MKSFFKKNLLSIILAGIILLMIPVVIIVSDVRDKRYELAGVYNRNGQMYDTYADYTAVIEKQSDGSHKVTYTEDSNLVGREMCSCEFILPVDYEYGKKIMLNSENSNLISVKVDIYPGHLLITGYEDTGAEYFKQILRNEEYSEYNPIGKIVVTCVLTLFMVAFVISILVKFRGFVGVITTIVVAFLAIILCVKDVRNINYDGYYAFDVLSENVEFDTFFYYNDIYLKKTGQNSYKMLTNIVGSSMLSSTYYTIFDCITFEKDVVASDGSIIIESKDGEGVIGIIEPINVSLERQGNRYVICNDQNEILCEYRKSFGVKDYSMVLRIVRILGVLAIFITTVKMFISDRKREKPDVFEPFYGTYEIGGLICAGDGYSDYATHAINGYVGGRMRMDKDSFEMNGNGYDKVNYKFIDNWKIPQDMLPMFKKAKVIDISVENNRYYLLHTKKQEALITTLGDKMLMALKVLEYREGGAQDGSR